MQVINSKIKDKALAGIIIYSPDNNLINLVEELIQQNVKVVLFINKGNEFSDFILKNKKVIHIESGSNVGVSEGLNNIIKTFLKLEFNYLFTFDQDSMIDKNFIRNMIVTYKKAFLKNKRLVCCSPTIMDSKFTDKQRLIMLKKNKKEKEYQFVNFAITSGSMFTKFSFETIGLMNTLLFIDGVDTDWCERAVLSGYKLIKTNNIFLLHKIGSKYINFFGIKKSYHDQDLRVYYIMRNSLYLLIYGSNTIRWKMTETFRTIIRFLAYPILSSTKFKTVYFIILAFKDVFIGKMGKMIYIKH